MSTSVIVRMTALRSGREARHEQVATPSAAPPPSAPRSNLPEPASELIGRDASMRAVVELVTSQRLLTLTSADVIGKTRLSLEVARQLSSRFPDGVGLVELGPPRDPQLISTTVTTGCSSHAHRLLRSATSLVRCGADR